ncbi:RluA family pseudouridine synthase [Haloferula sargassicola]|uniref:Ribosomal large subunit pseudouridine synthase D n=1 Tax=Haloferula sargassicola TaxID=490096 RepID=A0ABP9UJC2_9BACT
MRAVCEFEVIDESPDWIVVSKPAPLAVHPANGKVEPTLLGGLEALLAAELAGGGRLSILTRLDRETSGLVLIAKNPEAARELGGQLARRSAHKEYEAIVHGWPEWDERQVDEPILRAGEAGESAIWLRQRVHPDGRACCTGFKVAARFSREGAAFARMICFPLTGRTHQIRAHLEHVGHPLVGDKIYGTAGEAYLAQFEDRLTPEIEARLMLPRQALHARALGVEWRGAELRWECPLPPDLARFFEGTDLAQKHG